MLPIFEKLKPQQRLVNILFDEVKLIQAMHFTGGHVLGYANNTSEDLANDNNSVELASHALVIEITCHFGGPRYILRVLPVAKLKADSLKKCYLTLHTL